MFKNLLFLLILLFVSCKETPSVFRPKCTVFHCRPVETLDGMPPHPHLKGTIYNNIVLEVAGDSLRFFYYTTQGDTLLHLEKLITQKPYKTWAIYEKTDPKTGLKTLVSDDRTCEFSHINIKGETLEYVGIYGNSLTFTPVCPH
jgi:hypothetical protein